MAKTYRSMGKEATLKLYEVKLSTLFATLRGSLLKTDHGQKEVGFLTGKTEEEGLPAIPARKPNNVSLPYKKYSMGRISNGGPLFDTCGPLIDAEIRNEACLNPKCTLYGGIGKGNIISKGTYQTKEGIHVRRFLCKACNKLFCSRAGSIFYDLRSPQKRVLMALELLAKGMSLRSVAKVLGVKRDTARNWLKVAAEQSGKIDAMLRKELRVSQVQLDTLWTSVRDNSLRQRAILWKRR